MRLAPLAVLLAFTLAGAPPTQNRYEDLVALFHEWRSFQRPRLSGGAPDYSAAAMAAQHRELPAWRQRLEAIDPSGWPVPQRVDWRLVRAEMDGLDFDHRVLRPWANNPAFYVTVFPSQSDQPAREGPHADGSLELWTYTFPLAPARAAEMERGLRMVPALLAAARTNLVGNGADLWRYGAASVREQSVALERLLPRVADAGASLTDAVAKAKEATDAFAAWLDAEAPRKTGPSGIGVENYSWYLRHVQLVPHTWRDQVTLMERELARARAFLALEEERNAGRPQQEPIASAAEYERRMQEGISSYMTFLRERRILTVRDYMEPSLRARVGRFNPGPREFFSEVDYRDPTVMRTHGFHWFDLARLEHAPHASPIRRGPLLYNIFISRTEGHATGWEEMMLQAGMFDDRPRSRELIYVLLAQRAARALGDLRMHANELTLEQAAQFTSSHTPRGWLRLEGRLVRAEQHLYLQQPAYGTSYVAGKIQIEDLLAAYRRQKPETFTLQQFMDAFDAVGLIPVSLIRWELTGEDELKR